MSTQPDYFLKLAAAFVRGKLKEDNNPEHIHLFDQERLCNLLREQGITRVSVEYVLNHIIVVARIGNHE